MNLSNYKEQWKLEAEAGSWVPLHNPPCGMWGPVCPMIPLSPGCRTHDYTSLHVSSSARGGERSADTGPVWGAGPVSETEPGIWTPTVTRCTGHVTWTRDTAVKKLFVSKKETVRDKGLWLLLPRDEFLTIFFRLHQIFWFDIFVYWYFKSFLQRKSLKGKLSLDPLPCFTLSWLPCQFLRNY